MKQSLTFGTTDLDRKRFKLIYTGFRAWARDQKNAQNRNKKDRKSESEILKALNSISVPIGDYEDTDFDFRDRKLNGGGDIILSGSAYSLLKERLDEAPMSIEVVVDQEEMLDWLKGSAKEVNDGTKE